MVVVYRRIDLCAAGVPWRAFYRFFTSCGLAYRDQRVFGRVVSNPFAGLAFGSKYPILRASFPAVCLRSCLGLIGVEFS